MIAHYYLRPDEDDIHSAVALACMVRHQDMNGITNWKNRGIAFSKEKRIFKYTDGTENYWKCIQRPTVYVENGHPVLFHFSVIDSGKGGDTGNDNNGSKIVIVPFDGEAFDNYMKSIDNE